MRVFKINDPWPYSGIERGTLAGCVEENEHAIRLRRGFSDGENSYEDPCNFDLWFYKSTHRTITPIQEVVTQEETK